LHSSGCWPATTAPFVDARDEIESRHLEQRERCRCPQQEVVNGGTTIEYLNLLSVQQEHDNNRHHALLFLILISGLDGYTHHHLTRRGPVRSSSD
jgi:hypothetical protein